jgi:large subunit ribosomal protein L13
MIIDGKDAILGRLSSHAAKQVLLGNSVDVINCEECVISGKKAATMKQYVTKLHRRAPAKGPYFYRRPDMLVKRTIRGMLPFKRSRGRIAFKSIKCHIGTPENLKDKKSETIKNINLNQLKSADYVKIKLVCKLMGWK